MEEDQSGQPKDTPARQFFTHSHPDYQASFEHFPIVGR
jgi:hypothetical protein